MKNLFVLLISIMVFNVSSQTTPKLYVNICSHNEMTTTGPYAELYDTNPAFFKATRDTACKIADMVAAKGAKWNLETCQRFVLSSIAQESAAITSTDVLQYCNMKGGVSGSVIEIDPRYKTTPFTQYTLDIADVAHVIDSTGATASDNLGGFLYYNGTLGNPYSGEDWTQYQNTTFNGAKYHVPWKAKVIWGPGSSPPHSHDANNYGIWQPKTGTDSINFYTHLPSASNVWLQGNGCSPVVSDSNVSVQWIVNYFRDVTNKIKSGAYPANKFYVASVMTGFKHYASTGFRQRLTTVVDSINNMVGQGSIVWATISQKQTAFNAWTASTSIAYSQWNCGQAPVSGIEEYTKNKISVYPNPSSSEINISGLYGSNVEKISIYNILGVIEKEVDLTGREYERINISGLKPGCYFLNIAKQNIKIIKE